MKAFAVSLAVSLVLAGCDDKKAAPAPSAAPSAPSATVPAPTAPTTPPAAPPAQPSASAARPASTAKVTLRQLIGTEKNAQETRYVDCMLKACTSVFKECYGEKVEQGEFGGPCGDLANCNSQCLAEPSETKRAPCNAACLDKFKQDGSACDTCGDKIGACATKGQCMPPIALPH